MRRFFERKKWYKLIVLVFIVLLFSFQTTSIALSQVKTSDEALKEEIKKIDKKEDTEKKKEEIIDKTSATFFKNVVGGLANTLAKKTAKWVLEGAKGTPAFIDDFGGFIEGYADAVIGDLVSEIVKDATGLDICSLDPKISLNLSLGVPFFDNTGSEGPLDSENCTLSELQDHWKKVGEGKFFDASLKLNPEGGFGGATEDLASQVFNDQALKVFPNTVWAANYLGSANFTQVAGVAGVVDPATMTVDEGSGEVSDVGGSGLLIDKRKVPYQEKLIEHAAKIVDFRSAIQSETDAAIEKVRNGNPLTKEELRETRNFYVHGDPKDKDDTGIEGKISEITTTIIEPIQKCLNKPFDTYRVDCAYVAEQLNMPINERTPTEEGDKQSFLRTLDTKLRLTLEYGQTMSAAYSELKQTITDTFKEEYLNSQKPFELSDALKVFDDKNNELGAQDKISNELVNKGLNSYLNRATQSIANNGWKAVTDLASDIVKSPANLISGFTEENLSRSPILGRQLEFTGEIVADASGVFMAELWNGLMAKMILELNGGGGTTNQYDFQAGLDDCKEQIEADPENISDFCQSVLEEQGINSEAAQQQIISDIAAGQAAADAISRALLQNRTTRPDNSAYEQVVRDEQATRDRIDAIARVYEATAQPSALNLFTEFQTQVTGQIRPNIYNNVLDSGFALAINNKLTIAQALEQNRLQGNFRFSFGEKSEERTYNIANIKKLRKARVLPLGFELAAQLVQDCQVRVNDLGNDSPDTAYADITSTTPYGEEDFGLGDADIYGKTLAKRRCVFRPYEPGDDIAVVRTQNFQKLQEVLNATVKTVVDGYDKRGSGICGDFDPEESPFCNLVNPNWVLKLPLSKCLEVDSDVPEFGELIQSPDTGVRYERCVNIASCLQEDGRGNCIDEQYGYCVKEENTWQFAAAQCDAAFSSCTTYRVSGQAAPVAYLQNTLSGNAICNPENAGCSWYSTVAVDGTWRDFGQFTDSASCTIAGGNWLGDRCENTRIYFNRNVATCSDSQEGCTELIEFKREGNNLLVDSSFEYTDPQSFPEKWGITVQKQLTSGEACAGEVVERCENYPYTSEPLCEYNGGSWDPGTEQCSGASNTVVDNDTCLADGGAVISYCREDVVRTNVCLNGKYQSEDACTENFGTWSGTCTVGQAVNLSQDSCNAAGGTWIESCVGAVAFPLTQSACEAVDGEWKGEMPYALYAYCADPAYSTRESCEAENQGNSTWEIAFIAESIENSETAYHGRKYLRVHADPLRNGEEIQMSYTAAYKNPEDLIVQPGEVYSVESFIRSSGGQVPLRMSLLKTRQGGEIEENTQRILPSIQGAWTSEQLVLGTQRPGTDLNVRFIIPYSESGGTVDIDSLSLGYHSLQSFVSDSVSPPTQAYTSNSKVYYRTPPEYLSCNGYDVQNPAPVLPFTSQAACEAEGGFWDQAQASIPPVYNRGTRCYAFPPDDAECGQYTPVCTASEVGCNLYTPANGDPAIPGVVTVSDYCPAQCVGYGTFRQEPNDFVPDPQPRFVNFIPDTAQSCPAQFEGCSEFTNLAAAAQGGEQLQYFSYLRQCIRPDRGLGEKAYFTWRSREGGSPELISYILKSDPQTGAPDTITGEGDCRVTLGEENLNCIKFYETEAPDRVHYRDIRKTITVSEECTPYRKTRTIADDVLAQQNCEETNGTWENDSCTYNVIPSEAIQCSAEYVGCTEYTGNRGGNIAHVLFDTFEDTGNLLSSWYVNAALSDQGSLANVGESLTLGGHSLLVPEDTPAIRKSASIFPSSSYTLSFWARTTRQQGDDLTVRFSTTQDDGDPSTQEMFAQEGDGNVEVTSEWKQYTLGPVFVSWTVVQDNALVISGNQGRLFIDNVVLSRSNDHFYAIQNSWRTPASCDQNAFGLPEPGAMLGCQEYGSSAGNAVYLKSFTNLCRERSVGCQAVIDTQNSTSPRRESYNLETASLLDDVTVPADELKALVLSPEYLCSEEMKGCSLFGRTLFADGGEPSFQPTYLVNDPDRYENTAGAILCSDSELGCQELTNLTGGKEYYKIEQTKLCEYSDAVQGWVKQGNVQIGCSALVADGPADCAALGGVWNAERGQCSEILHDIVSEAACVQRDGIWQDIGTDSPFFRCLADPFGIYSSEAAQYEGWVGECSTQYNGCTEFTAVNPNYIFNGAFETINVNNRLSSWTLQNSNSGTQEMERENVESGNQSVRLVKRTDAIDPQTSTQNPAAPFLIQQNVARLEAGETYEVSIRYYSGDDTKGVGTSCVAPPASISVGLEGGGGALSVFPPKDSWATGSTVIEVPGDVPGGVAEYTLRVYAPQNGVCTTEEDQISCAINGVYKDGACQRYQREDGSFILNQTECAALGGTWTGYCPGSSVLYDKAQLKPATEESYHVIDTGQSIDRASCSRVDWNEGCIQFTNTATGTDEIIQVQRDRQCAEWIECTERYPEGSGYCIDTGIQDELACLDAGQEWLPIYSVCRSTDPSVASQDACKAAHNTCQGGVGSDRATCEASGGVWKTYAWFNTAGLCQTVDVCRDTNAEGNCVTAPKNDAVRYAPDAEPAYISRLDVIAHSGEEVGYMYRFGSSAVDRVTQWRAGDYSGYTIPGRYPIESDRAFYNYPVDTAAQRYTTLQCKIFPEENSPLPYQLSQIGQYQNLTGTYVAYQGYTALDQIGSMCSYRRVDVQGTEYIYPSTEPRQIVSEETGVCARPAEKAGQTCDSYLDCTGGFDSGAGILDDGSCIAVSGVKNYYGIEGLCLESDVTNPLYEDIFQNPENFINPANLYARQPYACLSYYPYEVDWASVDVNADGFINFGDVNAAP